MGEGHKRGKPSLPEMEALIQGMQELLTDEYGNPLPKDDPRYKSAEALIEQIGNAAAQRDESLPDEPKGEA